MDFDIQNIIKNINTVSQNLNKMKLPNSLFKGLDKDAGDLIEKLKKIAPQLQQSFKNPKDLASLQKQIEGLIKDYSAFENKAINFGIDIKDIRRFDESLKELRDRVKEIKSQLESAKGTKIRFSSDFDKAAINADKLAKLQSARTAMNKIVKNGGTEEELRVVANKYSIGGRDKEALIYKKELTNLLEQELEKRKAIATLIQQLSQAEGQLDTGAAAKVAEYMQNFANLEPELKQGEEAINKVDQAVNRTSEDMSKAIATQNEFSQLGQRLKQLTSITSVMLLTRRAIRGICNDIKELDTAFNEISVVTGKTMDEMWNGFSKVNQVAQQYGVTSKGVIEVQNMYYHQGLNDIEVTKRTAETLTLAKIAGLDYADATDKMTAALNGFKLSAEQAGTVTDVTAALASSAAASSEEIMNALTKTASISGSAGTSFENTEVFLTKMIETTRESSENLGTALKTVTARFSELKSAVDEDEDGEVADFNKVDTALKSVGITIRDTAGQMRDFDDIILELSSKWDSLDRNTQRYIATQAAGSRQQSRFIALVDDYNRLLELQNVAQNAAGTGARQLVRSQESLETTLNKITASLEELFTTFVQGQDIKGLLDTINKLIGSINTLSGGGKFAAIGAGFFGLRVGAKVAEKVIETLSQKIVGLGKSLKTNLNQNLVATANNFKYSQRHIERYEKQLKKTSGVTGNYRKQLRSLRQAKLAEAQAYQATQAAQKTDALLKATNTKKVEGYAAAEAFLNIEKKKNLETTGLETISDEAAIAVKELLIDAEAENIALQATDTALTEKNTAINAQNVMSQLAQLGVIEGLSNEQKEEMTTLIAQTLATKANSKASEGNTGAKVAETVATKGLGAALTEAAAAAWAFIAANPGLVIIAAALAGIVTTLTIASKKQSEAMKENAEAIDKDVEAAQNYSSDVSKLKGLVTDLQRAEELEAKGVLASAEEKEELQTILQDLQSEYPNLIQQIDDETLALKNQTAAQEALNQAKKDAFDDAKAASDKYLVAAQNMSEDLKQQIQYLESEDVLGRALTDQEIAQIIQLQASGVNKKKAYEKAGFTESEAKKLQKNIFNLSGFFGTVDQEGEIKLSYLNKDELEKNAREQLVEKTIPAAAAAQGESIGENLQKALINSFKDQELEGKSQDEIQNLVNKVVENLYSSVTDKQLAQLETALGKAKTETTQKTDLATFLGIDDLVIDKNTKQILEDYVVKLKEERDKAFKEFGDELGLSDDELSKLTLSQLKAMNEGLADVEKDATADVQSWRKSWLNIMSDLPEDLQQQFAQIDWTDTESLNQFRTVLIQTYGDGTNIVQRFNDIVDQSGDIANKQIPPFEKLSETIKKDIEKAEKNIQSLGSAIKGELNFEDMVDLVTAKGSGLSFEDFTATADGFKLSANSAENARKALLAQTKAEYENRIADYELIQSKLELERINNELAISEAIVQKQYATEASEIQRLNAIIETRTGMSEQLQQQITKNAEQIDNAKKGIEALNLAYEYLDMAGQKELWEANQEEIKKTADKLKDVYDRLKDIFEMIKEIDPTKTLKDMSELLDLEKSDFEATLDLNINPTINKKAIQSTISNINKQIAVQGAIEATEKKVQQTHADIIKDSPYMTINEQGVATITDKIQELRNKAAKAKNSEEFEYYKDLIKNVEVEVDAYNDSVKAAQEASTKKKAFIKEQAEYYKNALNKSASLERRVLDVLISNDEKELDSFKQTIEKKKQAQQDYLNSVQEAIDKERRMRDLADAEEGLRLKERKLSILEMDTSGMYAGDVAGLQKDIANDRRSLQDTYVDNYITQQSEDIDKLSEAYDRDIEAWENYLGWKKEDMRLYQEAIDSIISNGTEYITNFIMTKSDEVLGKTKDELAELKLTISNDVNDEISWYEALREGGFEPVIEAIDSMKEGTETVEEATKKYTDAAIIQYGDLSGSISDVTKELADQQQGLVGLKQAWEEMIAAANKYLAAIQNIEDTEPTFKSSGLGLTTHTDSIGHNAGYTREEQRNQEDWAKRTLYDKSGWGAQLYSENGDKRADWILANGSMKSSQVIGIMRTSDGILIKTETSASTGQNPYFKAVKGETPNYDEYERLIELYGNKIKYENGKWVSAYAKGGYVKYTGPAWVDGTPGQPEAFLDAQDTRNFEQLRDILGSLMGNIAPSPNVSQTSQDTYTIEINVGTLGDDYTIDDLAAEIEEKIYEQSTRQAVTRI